MRVTKLAGNLRHQFPESTRLFLEALENEAEDPFFTDPFTPAARVIPGGKGTNTRFAQIYLCHGGEYAPMLIRVKQPEQ
jgi:hypothetical protein